MTVLLWLAWHRWFATRIKGRHRTLDKHRFHSLFSPIERTIIEITEFEVLGANIGLLLWLKTFQIHGCTPLTSQDLVFRELVETYLLTDMFRESRFLTNNTTSVSSFLQPGQHSLSYAIWSLFFWVTSVSCRARWWTDRRHGMKLTASSPCGDYSKGDLIRRIRIVGYSWNCCDTYLRFVSFFVLWMVPDS